MVPRDISLVEKTLLALLGGVVYYISYAVMGIDTLYAVSLGAAAAAAAAMGSRVSLSVPGGAVSVNLGGFVVPFIVATDLFLRFAMLYPVVIPVAVASVAAVSLLVFVASRDLRGRGIGVPAVLPIFLGAAFSALIIDYYGLGWLYAAPLSVSISVYGVVLGADLFKVMYVRRVDGKNTRYDLGGAGLLDVVYIASAVSPSLGLALSVIIRAPQL